MSASIHQFLILTANTLYLSMFVGNCSAATHHTTHHRIDVDCVLLLLCGIDCSRAIVRGDARFSLLNLNMKLFRCLCAQLFIYRQATTDWNQIHNIHRLPASNTHADPDTHTHTQHPNVDWLSVTQLLNYIWFRVLCIGSRCSRLTSIQCVLLLCAFVSYHVDYNLMSISNRGTYERVMSVCVTHTENGKSIHLWMPYGNSIWTISISIIDFLLWTIRWIEIQYCHGCNTNFILRRFFH